MTTSGRSWVHVGRRSLGSVLVAGILLACTQSGVNGDTTAPGRLSGALEPTASGDPTSRLADAVRDKLVLQSGGIISYLRPGKQEDGRQAGAGHERLSESTGLLLIRAAAVGDPDLFALVTGHYRARFRVDTGLAHWKLDPADRPVPSEDGEYSSAPIDELRIAQALMSGAAAFSESSYADDVRHQAKALLAGVADGVLTDDISWGPGPPSPGDRVALGYLHIASIRALAAFEPAWADVAERSLVVLRGAVSSSAPPWQFFVSGRYGCDGMCETTPGLWSGLHLQGAGDSAAAQAILQFYLQRVEQDGMLSDAYSPQGEASGVEELAAYALLARLAARLGDEAKARQLVDEWLLPHQHADGPAAGLVSYEPDDASAFDNLEILLTLTELGGFRVAAD